MLLGHEWCWWSAEATRICASSGTAFCAWAGEQQGVVGLMLPERFKEIEENKSTLIYRWGEWTDTAALASRLFAGLRELDARGAEVIVCPVPAADGIGGAVRDRLFKAAMK